MLLSVNRAVTKNGQLVATQVGLEEALSANLDTLMENDLPV
jgi:hypothetical protein